MSHTWSRKELSKSYYQVSSSRMFRGKFSLQDSASTPISLTCQSSQNPNLLYMSSVLKDSVKHQHSLESSFSGQKVCEIARCFRCQKPRCLYSSKPLTSSNRTLLHQVLTTSVFACSSAFLPPGHSLEKTLYTKNLDCSMDIESEFYHSAFSVQNTCSKCAGKVGEISKIDKRKKIKRLQLPICKKCQMLQFAVFNR